MNNWFYRHKTEALENAEGLKSSAIILVYFKYQYSYLDEKYYLYVYWYFVEKLTGQGNTPKPTKPTFVYPEWGNRENSYIYFFLSNSSIQRIKGIKKYSIKRINKGWFKYW